MPDFAHEDHHRSALYRPRATNVSADDLHRVAEAVSRRVHEVLARAGGTVTAQDEQSLDALVPAEASAQLADRLLDDMAAALHADLIGGTNVTRLDRALNAVAPRLRWDEALDVLQQCGRPHGHDGRLDHRAQADLTRHAGGLPLHLTDLPGRRRSTTLLPFGGCALETDGDRLRVDLHGLRNYVLGGAAASIIPRSRAIRSS